MKKGIIFDMDGTVWDSSENVARAWTVKVREAGYTDKEVTRKDIQSVMGKPMDVIADTLFTYTEKGPEHLDDDAGETEDDGSLQKAFIFAVRLIHNN